MEVGGAYNQKTGGRFEWDQRKHEERDDGDTGLDCTLRKGGFPPRFVISVLEQGLSRER